MKSIVETKPDTISAIDSGSSFFYDGRDRIGPGINNNRQDTEYDLWLDLDAQIYTSLTFALVGGTEHYPVHQFI